MARRILVALGAVVVVVLSAVVVGPSAMQWWSVRRSGNPDVALAALTCESGRGRVVTGVSARPWGWVVTTADWQVAYFGFADTSSGAPGLYVTERTGRMVAWFSGSSPPTDPVTGEQLSAAGADNPWEADLALAVVGNREPYVAQRCTTRQF